MKQRTNLVWKVFAGSILLAGLFFAGCPNPNQPGNSLSSDASLSDLLIVWEELVPLDFGFTLTTTTYDIDVPNSLDEVTVTPQASSSGTIITVNGTSVTSGQSITIPFAVGINVITVDVTAADGVTVNTYLVNVNRAASDQTNANVAWLLLSEGELMPDFDEDTLSYSTSESLSVDEITVTPFVSDSNATLKVNGGDVLHGTPSDPISLNPGNNDIIIVVTAGDLTTTKTYTVTVRRQSDNADLSGLTISSGTLVPDFSSSITGYTATVLNAVSSVTVTATTADAGATLEVQLNGGEWQAMSSGSPSPQVSLELGVNTVEVMVAAEDTSTTKTYSIIVARRYPGMLDIDFATGDGAFGRSVGAIALQSDGKVLIGGNFLFYDGVVRKYLARLNSDGSLDSSFVTVGTGLNGSAYSIALQADGKILIGGWFTSYNGTPRGRIARLNSDGSLDTSFLATGAGANESVLSIVLQSDGKILIVGWFGRYNSSNRVGIARLNSDGSLDSSFLDTGEGFDPNGVYSIALQPDGKILIGGSFTSYNGTARGGIARLNSDGSLDTSFLETTEGIIGGPIESVAVQSDGKILIGGSFIGYNSVIQKYFARLNSDGSLDTSFTNIFASSSSAVEMFALQSDDKILIDSGQFFGRLNSDGSLDSSFSAGTNGVYAIALQSDGRILIGGGFSTVNGVARGAVARLWGD